MRRVHNPKPPKGGTETIRVFSFEDTDPANLQTAAHDVIVTAYAAVHCMEESLWERCHELDDFNDPNIRPLRDAVSERQKALSALYMERYSDRVLTIMISGNPRDGAEIDGEEVSNYTVEDAIRGRLGTDGIDYDSESGWFVIYCTEGRRDEILADIAANHPYMDVHADTNASVDDGDAKPPMISSWSSSAKWLKDRNLTTVIDIPDPQPKEGAALTELLDEARQTLIKTGYPLRDAIALLLERS